MFDAADAAGMEFILAIVAIAVVAFFYFRMQEQSSKQSQILQWASTITATAIIIFFIGFFAYAAYRYLSLKLRQKVKDKEETRTRRTTTGHSHATRPRVSKKPGTFMVADGGDEEGGGAASHGGEGVGNLQVGNLLWVADKGLHLMMVTLGVLYTAATLNSNVHSLSAADQQRYVDRMNMYGRLWRLLTGLHLRMFFVHQGAGYVRSAATGEEY